MVSLIAHLVVALNAQLVLVFGMQPYTCFSIASASVSVSWHPSWRPGLLTNVLHMVMDVSRRCQASRTASSSF